MKTKAISYVAARIEAIQQELEQLRKTLAHQEDISGFLLLARLLHMAIR